MMKPNAKRIISQLVNNLDIPRSGKSLDEDDSWYLTVSNGSYQNVEIRISNHKTDINTWAFRQYRGQSPSTRISIVFRDNNYAGNVLLHEPVRRQISVTEYVYDLTDGSTLSDKEIAMLTKAIRAAASGSFVDPLGMATESDVVGKYVAQNTTTTNNGDTVPSTKWNHGMDSSIEESKTNKNMKKNVVKINENTLRQIVAESVKKALNEDSQENAYRIICNLEEDLKTVISNTDSSSSQAFGSPDEKLKMISNRLSHIEPNLSMQAEKTFKKLLEVISELQDIRINLKTLGAKDQYWGHSYETPNGTVGLSNYR